MAATKSVVVIAPRSPDGFVEVAGDPLASLEQYRYVFGDEATALAASSRPRSAPVSRVYVERSDGFEFVGGETGWQLAPHKLVWRAGGFAV